MGPIQLMSADSPSQPPAGPQSDWKTWFKCVVSLWICYHLAGLVISPASIPPSSDLVRGSWPYVGPYLQFLSMNQGHHFFAPDPGPSTLIRYTVERANGTRVAGILPNRETFPRLLYHRHFMLTESVAALEEEDQRTHSLLVRALARELCQEHGGEAISLSRVTHLLPTPEWFRAGERIDDPSLYEVKPLGRFEWSDFSEQ